MVGFFLVTGGDPLCLVFPLLFRVVVNKLSSVKESYVVEGWFVSWVVAFRKGLC